MTQNAQKQVAASQLHTISTEANDYVPYDTLACIEDTNTNRLPAHQKQYLILLTPIMTASYMTTLYHLEAYTHRSGNTVPWLKDKLGPHLTHTPNILVKRERTSLLDVGYLNQPLGEAYKPLPNRISRSL